MFAVKSNRTISVQEGGYQQVQSLKIPEEGRIVLLRNWGFARLYHTRLKNELRHYVIYHHGLILIRCINISGQSKSINEN